MTTDLVALIVDEQITGRRILRNRLGRMGFREVLETPDDRKAWEVLRTRDSGVDLIVSANEDTVDLVHRVRRDGRLRSVPFLVVSEHADGATVLEAIRAGAEQSVVDTIKFNRGLNGVPEKDAALIRLGRAIFRDHKVSSEVWAQMERLFGRQGAVELTIVMADYAMAGFILTAVLGMAGSFLGAFVGGLIRGGNQQLEASDPYNWIGAILGALLILFIYGMVAGRKPTV